MLVETEYRVGVVNGIMFFDVYLIMLWSYIGSMSLIDHYMFCFYWICVLWLFEI